MPAIVLATLNAKWIHASFGLRCLRANLGELRDHCAIVEFDIQNRPADVAERILAAEPRIVGLGVYVWNAQATAELVTVLKAIAPDVVVVLGGPEVSHETEAQSMCAAAAAKHLSMSADSLRTIMFRQIAERPGSMGTILGAGNHRHRGHCVGSR